MHMVRAHRAGGPEVMQLDDVPTPAAATGQALIRVEAAGVNFIDIYHRSGQYPAPLPILLGLEGAGVVETAGEGAGVAPGDRVAWASAPGSYASHVLVDADRLVPVPDGIDARTAAAAMLQGLTAHYLTRSTYALAKEDTCVVHAAAGGVGLLLCQMAKIAGARVIGTVSTEEKAEHAREALADEVVVTTQRDFQAEVLRLTGGAGASVVYDGIGNDTFAKSLDSLRRRGMLVLYGQASGAVPPLDPQILAQKGSLFVTRPRLGDYVATREELLSRVRDIFRWILAGQLKVSVGTSFPLAQAGQAHERLAARKTIGKVLLIP
jgi:NADPH2:quinone reductase